ncbi:MAG: putative porin, partial [Bacteroidales bacterium]
MLELDFFKRNDDPDQYLYGNLKPYMHHTGNKTFIETQVPFTELKFTFGGPRTVAEQSLGVRHSQNVNRYLNVGLDLDIVNSLGQYIYQSTDNRAFTLHSSYLGPRYRVFAAWSLNNMKRDENGGIVFEGSETTGVDDPSFLATYDTRDVPVNLGRLNSAVSELRNRNLLVVQRYRIGGGNAGSEVDTVAARKGNGVEGTLSHIFSLDKTRRSYFDDLPFGGFYDTAYISNDTNNLLTRDSLFYRILKNTVRFDFATSESSRFRLGIG